MPQFRGLQATRIHSSARPNDGYEYIFATRYHNPIRTLKELRACGYFSATLGLFWNGVFIGSGELDKKNWRKKWIHTDSVGLENKYRRKGHGLALYIALIDCATALGAKRLYSSQSLNRYSERMWREKLGKAGYAIKTVGRNCHHPCQHCRRKPVYYIDL